jgi:hypothetical protein
MISLQDWITSSGKYPERAKSNELTEDVVNNAMILLLRVNNLLKDLNFSVMKVSSGFRPSDVNAKIGGAKKSAHMTGKAIDLIDDNDQHVGKMIALRPDLLKKHGLMIENIKSTKNWVHLDWVERSYRESMMFNP